MCLCKGSSSLFYFCFYTVADKLAAAVHTLANIQLPFSGHLFAGLLIFRVCLGCCGTTVLWFESVNKNTETRIQTQKYTCKHMPCIFFITRLYKTWNQPRLSRQDNRKQSIYPDIFQFFITILVVLLQFEDLLQFAWHYMLY